MSDYVCYVCDRVCTDTYHRVCQNCYHEGWTAQLGAKFILDQLPERLAHGRTGKPLREVPPEVLDYIMSCDVRVAVRKARNGHESCERKQP
jgi:hypothetical protein